MRKFILYAGMAFILSFYTAAKIEAGLSDFLPQKNTTPGITVSIDPTDPCAGGAVDSTYIFSAKSGSTRQITMARREVKELDDYSSTDWYYYDLPVYTKLGVQAGYYLESDGDLVLIMVYLADKEGKSGAIVSRISKDYGETWTESVNITENKHLFGLSVAPNSNYVVIYNIPEISLHKLTWNTNSSWTDWSKEDDKVNINHPDTQTTNRTYGLSVIFDDPLVSVAFVNCKKKLKIRNYNTSTSKWTDYRLVEDGYNNDTAWLCNDIDTANKRFLAAKRSNAGVRTTNDLTSYSDFNNWTDQGKFPVSGIWMRPFTSRVYILSTDNQDLFGISQYEQKRVLYRSNQGTSMDRRVSMFSVPAK